MISTTSQLRVKNKIIKYSKSTTEIIGLFATIISAAMLLNAADVESLSNSWKTNARWIGSVCIVFLKIDIKSHRTVSWVGPLMSAYVH